MTTEVTVRQQAAATVPFSPEHAQRLVDNRKAFEDVRVTTAEGNLAIAKQFIPPADAERTTLEQYLGELDGQLRPARREVIVSALARLANHRKNERSEREWQMLFEDYCEDLEEFSDTHILQAIKEHRRQSNWFPKIAELRSRCLELQGMARIWRRRCCKSLTGIDGAAA